MDGNKFVTLAKQIIKYRLRIFVYRLVGLRSCTLWILTFLIYLLWALLAYNKTVRANLMFFESRKSNTVNLRTVTIFNQQSYHDILIESYMWK